MSLNTLWLPRRCDVGGDPVALGLTPLRDGLPMQSDDTAPRHAVRVAPATGASLLSPWLVALVVGGVGFAILSMLVANHVAIPGDHGILALARGIGLPPAVWSALSESANIPLIVIGLGMVAWLFFTRRRREALVVLILLAAITAGSEGVKQLVARPRPEGTDPRIPGVVYSYPSGHVLEALTILGIIAIRTWRSHRPHAFKVGFVVAVAIWVFLVGLSRMALNAHYPSDVLAGVLGAVAALGFYGVFVRPGQDAAERQARR